MKTTDGHVASKVAEHLRDDEIHVWRLAYSHQQGRAPLRALLGAYLDHAAESLQLIDSEYGRPELAAPHAGRLGFNWSHSGDQALIAVARDLVPGIDLEQLRDRPRALEIARRYFSPEESAALESLDLEARSAAFLELWTAKEAVLKALGRGLAFGLHRLNIVMQPDRLHLQWLDHDDAAQWQLQRLHLDAEHVGALAWRGPPRQIRHWTLAAAD
ncbi:4'-phosphopantetheinyl transferase family protein [Dyella tabacisoli]|uniref:4-phosphopantetheinyl transferase n=1 Tax=Dyella tabacisoli TaxID=2282381 RepID=A0A369ULG4_9GAMM|nr:4'-phosphopantetheinyl transferase superfamily protein [Dyella tabacisoli]RDD80925.1 4-phosphopantetheinyl transferase [Dyella tabacisoli]